jgi:hypothetical protein
MKRVVLAILCSVFAATPVFATGGMICRTAGTQPIEIALVISHTAVPSIVSARLTEYGREIPVSVAQSWLEPKEVRLDLTDKQALRQEARLLVQANGRVYDGSLWRSGKRRWVRCREG